MHGLRTAKGIWVRWEMYLVTKSKMQKDHMMASTSNRGNEVQSATDTLQSQASSGLPSGLVDLQPMFCHGLCHWYSQPTPESYVIDTPAEVGRCLDSYIVDTLADTGWAKDLRCIQRAIWCPVVWHSDHPVCMGVYCWTRKLCSVAFQRYDMQPCTLCRP